VPSEQCCWGVADYIEKEMAMKELFVAGFVMALASAGQAVPIPITIEDAGFEDTAVEPSSSTTNWNSSAWYSHYGETRIADLQSPANGPVTTQVAYLATSGDGGTIRQNLSHAWSSTDKYRLSFDAYEVYWQAGGSQTNAVSAALLDGTAVLWSTPELINLDGTLAPDGSGGYIWGSTDHAHSYDIDASSFTTGVEGSNLILQFHTPINKMAYVDNVSLEIIPEPGSLGLLGFIGLACLLRSKLQARR
jgi:hypothetical protein